MKAEGKFLWAWAWGFSCASSGWSSFRNRDVERVELNISLGMRLLSMLPTHVETTSPLLGSVVLSHHTDWSHPHFFMRVDVNVWQTPNRTTRKLPRTKPALKIHIYLIAFIVHIFIFILYVTYLDYTLVISEH